MHSLDVSGAILWSNISKRTSRTALSNNLDALGLGWAAPAPRTPYDALKTSLSHVFKGETTLIRPLEDKDGFVVVDEDRGHRDNRYATRYTAKLPTENTTAPSIDPFNQHGINVLAEYDRSLQECGPTAVTGSLVKIINTCGGTRLRDHGGVYWIPGDEIDKWHDIKQAVLTSASIGFVHHLAIVSTGYDPESAEAIICGLTEEIESDIRELTSELDSEDGLGKRALDARLEGLTAKRMKVVRYEGIFNAGLNTLHDKLEVIKQSEAFATLLSAADSDEPSVFAH